MVKQGNLEAYQPLQCLEEFQRLWIVGPSSLLHHSSVREASIPVLTLNQVHAPCE